MNNTRVSISSVALALSFAACAPTQSATQTSEGGSGNVANTSNPAITGGSKSTGSAKVASGGSKSTSSSQAKNSGGKTSVSQGSEGEDNEGGASTDTQSTPSNDGGRSATGGFSGSSSKSASSSNGGSSGSSGKPSSTTGGNTSGSGTPAIGGQTSDATTTAPSGEAYNPDFKEFYGEDCEVGDPKDVNESKLPDLFQFVDGSRMSKKSEWRCRRAELKKIVEKYIHGEKPGTPEKVTGSVSKTSIKVHVEHKGKSIDFSVSVSMPASASGPVPAIIGLAGGSLDKSILSSEGVASISYDQSALASETSRSGLFTNIYGSTGASAQLAWAWGVSRIIDVLVAEKAAGRNDLIDPTGIGVTGCSRLGKGAFTIGAFDERIALGIPQESGTGGVSAFRVVNTSPMGPNGKPAQSLDSAWSEAQGWFGTAFGSYKGKVNTIPGDTHSLVAMYAPRGLLVLDNSRIGELGSVAQHAASAAGAEVYKAIGAEKNIEYHGGNATDPHNHCQFYASQAEPLKRAIRAHLTRKAAADGRIAPAQIATADMTKWIDWKAPSLE